MVTPSWGGHFVLGGGNFVLGGGNFVLGGGNFVLGGGNFVLGGREPHISELPPHPGPKMTAVIWVWYGKEGGIITHPPFPNFRLTQGPRGGARRAALFLFCLGRGGGVTEGWWWWW